MYETLLLIDPDTPLTAEELREELASFYTTDPSPPTSIELVGSNIRLAWPGFTLTVGYSEEPHVIEESREIAEQFAREHEAYQRIQQCKARFEIAGDDDLMMNHFNDQVFVIEAAQRLATVYAFDSTSSEFI